MDNLRSWGDARDATLGADAYMTISEDELATAVRWLCREAWLSRTDDSRVRTLRMAAAISGERLDAVDRLGAMAGALTVATVAWTTKPPTTSKTCPTACGTGWGTGSDSRQP